MPELGPTVDKEGDVFRRIFLNLALHSFDGIFIGFDGTGLIVAPSCQLIVWAPSLAENLESLLFAQIEWLQINKVHFDEMITPIT